MRALFLVLFLLSLSSSRRLYRRSEDVDPLLKELFSETKEPSPKDRRDGQTSGDTKSGDTKPASDDDAEMVNKTSPGKKEDDDSDDTHETPKDSDESVNQASISPKDDKPSEKSADSQAKDDGKQGTEDSKDVMTSDSESSGDSELFSSGAGESAKTEKSSAVSTDEKSPDLSGKESGEETKSEPAGVAPAVASPELASVSDKGAKPGDQMPDVTAAKDQSDQASEVASASVSPQTSDVTAAKDQSDHTSKVASASVSPQTSDVTAAKDQSDHTSEVASASVGPQTSDATAAKDQSDHTSKVASASVGPQTSDVTAAKDQSDHASKVASASVGPQTSDVTAAKDQSDHTSDVASASVHPETSDVTAAKDQSDHTSDVASASVHPETSDVTAAKDQSDHTSDVASASVSPETSDVTAAKDQSDHTSDVASASVSPETSDVTAAKDQSDHTSDVASASVSPETSDVTAAKDQSDHTSDVASASVHPETSDVTAAKDQSDHTSDVASASVSPETSDVTAAKDQSDHASDVASVSPQTSDVTAAKDQSDHESDVASASVSPQTSDQSDRASEVKAAAKDQSDHASEVASASVSPQTSDVTVVKDQSDHESDVASASVTLPLAARVQPEQQQPTVPGNHGAEINSDTSQSMNYPNTMENTRSNIPNTPTNSDVLPNVVRQPSNNANMRSNIPQVPAAAAPRQDWPAVNQFPETNEKGPFMKKNAIPVAPSQPGSSSFPLQLNKHSPGAELMKRFFIAKKQAKKRKEEEAKLKSLIGDGKYTVNSNNGYYNYAAAPKVPAPSPSSLKENGKEGVCVDKFDSCPEFAKNHYCTDYKTLMKVQCRKSCKFCDNDDDDDDDDDEEGPGKSVKQDDDKKEKDTKTKDDDEDDDDSKAKTEDKDEEKQTKTKKKKTQNSLDDDDDDDDDDDIKLKSSESEETHSDSSGDSEVQNESGSGSGPDEKFEDISSEPSDKGSGSGEDLPPTAEELEDEDEKVNNSGSGSGGGDDDDDEKEGDNLAKDLAEQELFSQDVKKNSMPSPAEHAIPAPYPKIDLKDIARYVSLYRSVAKKLFGEALDSAKKEFVVQQSKRSDIPIPIKDKLNNEATGSSSSLEGFYSSQNSKKRDDIPMKPNNAQYTPNDETWANRAYKEAESYLRSKIPAFKNYAPPAMFNYPFYINDPNKTVEQTNEGTATKKSEIPTNPEEKYNKTLQDILKRDHINKPSSDPYQYLRDMIPGSSMKPIASKNGITYVPDSFSRPIQLRTKSQWQDLLAKKKNSIPKVPQSVQGIARSGVARPKPSVPQIQTRAEALAAQVTQYKSTGAPAEVANNVQTNSDLSQPAVARAEVPQPQMQQVPSAQSSNFLQSNEAVDQIANAASSFSEVQPNNKASNQTEAVSPLARVDRQAHHKDSSH